MARAKDWKLVRATADDRPHISKQFLTGERLSRGEATFMREFYCEFRAGRTQFVDERYPQAIFDTNFKALGE